MGFRSLRPSTFVVAVLTLVAALSLSAQDSHRGRKYKAPPQTSRVDVTILRKSDGKPVENAAVVFQMVGDKGNMEHTFKAKPAMVYGYALRDVIHAIVQSPAFTTRSGGAQ